MKYVKVLGLLDKEKIAGYYDFEKNVIVVDFGHGMLQAFLTSYHEFLHKTLDFFPIEDWVDLLHPLISIYVLGKPREWRRLFKILFFTERQTYYPLEDGQRVKG